MASSPGIENYRRAFELLHTPHVIDLLCLLDLGVPASEALAPGTDSAAVSTAMVRLVDYGHVTSRGTATPDELATARLTVQGCELVAALRDFDDYLVRAQLAAADHVTH